MEWAAPARCCVRSAGPIGSFGLEHNFWLRCLVTKAGRARGIEPADLLERVLDPAGLPSDGVGGRLTGSEGR
jgi:hypothetical protein